MFLFLCFIYLSVYLFIFNFYFKEGLKTWKVNEFWIEWITFEEWENRVNYFWRVSESSESLLKSEWITFEEWVNWVNEIFFDEWLSKLSKTKRVIFEWMDRLLFSLTPLIEWVERVIKILGANRTRSVKILFTPEKEEELNKMIRSTALFAINYL